MRMFFLAAAFAFAGNAYAADHRVEMLNKGPDGREMVFVPHVVFAQPGDTVTFVPTDPKHNSVTIKGGIPEGAEPWKGALGEQITATVSAEGVYLYDCLPHYGMGMIGAVVVGKPTNLEAVKALHFPGKAKDVAAEIFAEIEKGQ